MKQDERDVRRETGDWGLYKNDYKRGICRYCHEERADKRTHEETCREKPGTEAYKRKAFKESNYKCKSCDGIFT